MPADQRSLYPRSVVKTPDGTVSPAGETLGAVNAGGLHDDQDSALAHHGAQAAVGVSSPGHAAAASGASSAIFSFDVAEFWVA